MKNTLGRNPSLRTCGDIIESDDRDQREKNINDKQRDFRTKEGKEVGKIIGSN